MHRTSKVLLLLVTLLLAAPACRAQQQSTAPADRATTQRVAAAIAKAGIDPRITSVRVTTSADHVVHLSGLISDRSKIALAGEAAAKAAPGYRIVNRIDGSFFDDPNHVYGTAHPAPSH